MKTTFNFLTGWVVLVLAGLNTVPLCAAPAYPLKVSADSRYLVDQQDKPFFMHGDTAWSLIAQVSREDAELYLRDCAARGFNSVIVSLIEAHYSSQAPANYYGIEPFLDKNRFTTPNEAYFTHADWVIRKAAEFGLNVVLAPCYLGCCDDGWAKALTESNSVSDARWYGAWVGKRYARFPNIIFVWGNDLRPEKLRGKIRAMAEGAKSASPVHLHTYHSRNRSALDDWTSGERWLDLNNTYSYHPIQIKSLENDNRSPRLPYFHFESDYENCFNHAPLSKIRHQAYVAVLCGNCGHHFGNNPIWHMNGAPKDARDSWKNHLDDEGRLQMRHVRALFESRPWYLLRPDKERRIATSEPGDGLQFVAVAGASDHSTLIAYLPGLRPVSINMGWLSGTVARCWWFNPRTGEATAAGDMESSGIREFTPMTDSDWILVIDDADRRFPIPGASPSN